MDGRLGQARSFPPIRNNSRETGNAATLRFVGVFVAIINGALEQSVNKSLGNARDRSTRGNGVEGKSDVIFITVHFALYSFFIDASIYPTAAIDISSIFRFRGNWPYKRNDVRT